MSNLIEILKVVLLGIVEGITEWIPVSSTGHMILLNEFIQLDVTEEFFKVFDVVIQVGAILAVICIYWWKIWPFYLKDSKKHRTLIKKSDKDIVLFDDIAISTDAFIMWVKIVVTCLPAIVYGLLFDDVVTEIFARKIPGINVSIEVIIVSVMLIIVGVLFIIVEKGNEKKTATVNSISDITFKAAIIIGLFQTIAAALPGTSRSGATILGAMMIGISRVTAAEFTFYLAIPVMLGASLLKLVKYGLNFTSYEILILVLGMVVAYAVSMVVINVMMNYIKKKDFTVFGWYRIVLGVLVLSYFIFV